MKKAKIAGLTFAVLLALTPATTTTYAASTTNTTIKSSQATGAIDWNQIFDGAKDLISGIIKAVQGNGDQTNTDNDDPQSQAIGVVNSIQNVTYDQDHPVLLTNDVLKDKMNTPLSASDFAHLAGEDLKLVKEDQGQTIAAANNLTYTISSTYSPEDLQKVIDNLPSGNNASVKLTVTTRDENNAVKNTKDITFTNVTKAVAKTTDLNINYKTPANVDVGSDTLTMKLSPSATNNTTVENNNGQSVAYLSMDPGDFYSNKENARNYAHPLDLGSTFTQKGATYYQPVMINFDKAKFNIYDIAYGAMTTQDVVFNLNGQNVKWEQIDRNKSENSVTYVREITVGKDATDQPSDNNQTDNDQNNNNDNNAKPEDPVGVWKTTEQDGVLTVNNDRADLVDGDNNYTDRALGANTRWVTDAYRTNSATGVKQYHVSTNEWVDASKVSFSEQAPQIFTNILEYPGYHTVHLDGPEGFVYALYSKDGTRSIRGLAGNSDWATDQRATDSQGNVYYRVSTDEWVKVGEGVSVN